jgi:EAL domain-containing protein (putative c-di-GMP-specific phosphodiesterase class I)
LIGKLERNKVHRELTRPSRHSYAADELRACIAQGELINYYQPKVALATFEVVRVESLVRWQHPIDGIVFPDQFLGLAEQHGLLTDVTGVVLVEAMKQAKAWSQAGHPLSVAVNVSMDDLIALDFPDMAASLAASVGVEPRLLTLEVTEGQVMRQRSTILDVLSRLSLKRFGLSIDDFGTGHSSLAQLRDLPFNELHPDKSGIVYCKDSSRRKDYAKVSFTFLGYEFRPRSSKTRDGKFKTNFLPAISASATKRIRQKIRERNLPRQTSVS